MKKKFMCLICGITFICLLFLQTTALAQTDETHGVTRAEFCCRIAELLKNKGIKTMEKETELFDDISEDEECFDEIMWLKQLNVISGDGNGNFRPDDNITFQEAIALVGKVIGANQYVKENNEKYPHGYIKFALDEEFAKGVNTAYVNEITEKEAQIMINNLDGLIKIYDIMEPLGCDTYDGNVYIDYYPKSWQGTTKVSAVPPADYYNHVLPEKLLYSYDNEEWKTLYEEIDGEKVYYNIPEDVDIDGARYAWEYSCFVNAPFDVNKSFYSYDNITWHEGMPKEAAVDNYKLTLPSSPDEFPFGIDKEDIFYYDEEADLYFAKYMYEKESYTSEKYNTVLTEIKKNMVWVSKDLKKWIGIIVPEEVEFYTGVTLESRAQAYVIDCAVDFSEEENAYLDNEEKTAKELGLDYDRPRNKIEKYILRFSNVNKLFE